MPKSSLSLAQARRIAIGSQRLAPTIESAGKDGVASAIEHLGYIQIDTISVIARAHHHAIWQRCPDYDPAFLHELMAVDRRVFEYWAHAIAYLPMSDYRYYIPRMNRHRTSPHAWLAQWKREHASVLERVLQRIRKEGALASKDFVPPPGTKRGTWWDWKPSKRALEILFWQGDLMISERRGFQKLYDLTERVLPATTNTTVPSSEELSRFHVIRALNGLGVARAKEIREAFHIADLKSVSKTLLQMTKSKEVVPVSIEGLDDIYYVLPKSLEEPWEAPSQHAHILSPFDNLTIQRERMSRLFGFDYTLECYLPAAKRTHGYFVLPVLWNDGFIGRLDAKADRKSQTLIVHTLRFEPGFESIDEALLPLANALAGFARFNRCDAITFDVITPPGHKRKLKTLVRQAQKSFPAS